MSPSLDNDSENCLATRTRRRRRTGGVGLLSVTILTVAGLILWKSRDPARANYLLVPVDRGNIVRVTTASGMVNPVETVQIGSYASGRIQDLFCDYNSAVVKGQRCAKIDPRSYEAAVEQAIAAVGTAKAQLGKDQAHLAYVKLAFERSLSLSNRGVASQDATDNALNAYKQAEAQVAFDQATINQRDAELKAARVNLDFTDIISPVDGTVVSRSVAIGQTVAASFQTPTLFLIATDLTRMQVDANVSEAAIGQVHEGQKATFTVEAFPGRTFSGTVRQVRQAPVSVQNVISYDVVIEVANPDLALKAGMTATTRIVVAEKDDVPRIPESALRFAPGADAAERRQGAGSGAAGVWVLRNGALTRTPVTPGLSDDHFVEVAAGAIEPGDRVAAGHERDVGAPDASSGPAAP